MDCLGKYRLSSDVDEGNSVISKMGLKGNPSKYKVWQRQIQTLLSGVQWQDENQWAQTETKETSGKHKKTKQNKKLFYCDGGKTLKQVP